jgi:predicted P-loop ATPase
MQTAGVWIVELAELDSMSRTEVSKIKAFMSRSTDRFRPPYGKRVIEAPRQCIFAGSVNNSSYLRDETGARRFWPVACTRILIDDLARDRDQLWAEAAHQFKAGTFWWLDSAELNLAAEAEQAARYDGDAWDGVIRAWLEGRESVSIAEVLTNCISKPTAQWTQQDKNRISRSLMALGWKRYNSGPRSAREWRYKPVGVPLEGSVVQ